MKKNILQPFDSGLSLLTVRLTASSILNEFSLIENGALLRSLLQTFVSTLNMRPKANLVVKNEKSEKFLVSTVELTLPFRTANGQTLPLFLQATLMNNPNDLRKMISDLSEYPPKSQREKPPEQTDGIMLVGDAQTLLKAIEDMFND